MNNLGLALAIIGAAFAALFAGIGSIKTKICFIIIVIYSMIVCKTYLRKITEEIVIAD